VIENLLVGLSANPGERFINVLGLRSAWARAEQAGLEKAWALARDFDMDHLANVRADALSGGQRRLVELMRALMADPKVVLLDEPFAGISASIREIVADKVRKLPESGIAVLLVEHELEMLHLLADKVVVMARGEKVAEGHMSDVVELAEVQRAYVAG
jgi:branched-chain amino acid transport system ATP-binding protein